MKSARRILVAVFGAMLAMFAVTAMVVRQPGFRTKPFPLATRASPGILREHVAFFTTAVRPRGALRPGTPLRLVVIAQKVA